MDELKTLQTDLKTAHDALTALQAELPQFHALLTDNEQDAQRLKTERASLDAQAQARGRVSVAREMLEQHQSDIAGARAEVSRLEAKLFNTERRKALDTLQNRRDTLQNAWDERARHYAEVLSEGLDELYKLECDITLEQRDIAGDVGELKAEALPRISFDLRAAIRPHVTDYQNTQNHLSGLTLDRHHYRLTLSTEKLPYQDRS